MPTYDYTCDACGHEFEMFQPMSEEPKKKCPRCRKSKLRRLFGIGAALMFKGSGFYQTDYRSDSYKKAKAADSKASSEGSSSSSDSKSDSKSSGASPAKSESKPDSKPASGSKGKKTD